MNETAPCHGLQISESELETLLYDMMEKQAQVVLGVETVGDAAQLDMGKLEQDELGKQFRACRDRKRVLYEQLMLCMISKEEYMERNAEEDKEQNRLQQIIGKARQQKTGKKEKRARQELARKIVETGKLNVELADALIDRVFVYIDARIEVLWKFKPFFNDKE